MTANSSPWDDPGRPGHHIDHAGGGVGAPHGRGRSADHLDLLDVVGLHRGEIPEDDVEEIEVKRSPVHQGELAAGEKRARSPSGDVDVAGRRLDDIGAGNLAHEVADILRRTGLDGVAADDADGGGRVLEQDLGSGGGDDHGLFEGRLHLEVDLDGLTRSQIDGLLDGDEARHDHGQLESPG